jgi:cell division protein FtsN
MNRRIVQLVIVLGAVTACNRDKEPASLTQQPPADSLARPNDSTKLASNATKGAATKSAPTGTKSAPAGGTTNPARPTGGAPAGGGVVPERARDAGLTSASRLWTVQVGSFADPANASGMRDRLAALGVPVWTATTTVNGQQFTRVRVGVTTNTDDVRALANRLRTEYRWQVWLAMVEDKSMVPDDMLTQTQNYGFTPRTQ